MAAVASSTPTPSRDLATLVNTLTNYRAARAARLDRLADAELQHGHHAAAEHLAQQAAELRAVVR